MILSTIFLEIDMRFTLIEIICVVVMIILKMP